MTNCFRYFSGFVIGYTHLHLTYAYAYAYAYELSNESFNLNVDFWFVFEIWLLLQPFGASFVSFRVKLKYHNLVDMFSRYKI